MATTTIQTKHLGQIRGRTAEGVTQFLGIKYATLEDRLADAQLVEKHDGAMLPLHVLPGVVGSGRIAQY